MSLSLSSQHSHGAEGVLAGVGNVKETVLVLVLLVNTAHQSCRGRKNLVDEDEDGLLGRQLDALADDIDKLANGKIRRYEILFLVDGSNIALLDLFANDLAAKLLAQLLELVKPMTLASGCGSPKNSLPRTDERWVSSLCIKFFFANFQQARYSQECGRRIFDGCARPRPCASQRGAHP